MSGVLTRERERELVERLHNCWHPAPNACTENRPCYERRRARGVVRLLGPLLAGWLADDLDEHARRIDAAFRGDGDPDRTHDLTGEPVAR